MSKARVLEKISIDLDQDLEKIGKSSILVQLGPHRVAFERILKEVRAVTPVLSRLRCDIVQIRKISGSKIFRSI